MSVNSLLKKPMDLDKITLDLLSDDDEDNDDDNKGDGGGDDDQKRLQPTNHDPSVGLIKTPTTLLKTTSRANPHNWDNVDDGEKMTGISYFKQQQEKLHKSRIQLRTHLLQLKL
jgi:hypothetical protein